MKRREILNGCKRVGRKWVTHDDRKFETLTDAAFHLGTLEGQINYLVWAVSSMVDAGYREQVADMLWVMEFDTEVLRDFEFDDIADEVDERRDEDLAEEPRVIEVTETTGVRDVPRTPPPLTNQWTEEERSRVLKVLRSEDDETCAP